MRIESMRIHNFIGMRSLDLVFRQPVVLFAGRNGAGKSSVQAAVRMALLGEPERVLLKKDYDKLVAEGATGGEAAMQVRVGHGLDTESTVVHVTLPDGKPTPFSKRPPFLEHCLDPARFARLTEDERRSFLFSLTGIAVSSTAVVKALLERGCDEKLVNDVAGALRGGFSAGHKEATERARDAKAAWRGQTGEVWGKDKAETWKAKEVAFGVLEHEVLQRVQRDLATALEGEQGASRALAALEARAEVGHDLGGDPKKAGRVKSLEEDVATASTERTKWEAEVARLQAIADAPPSLACPHCGGLVVQDGFALKEASGGAGHERADAKAELARANESLKFTRTRITNLERDLKDAREHAAKVTAAQAVKDKAPTPHELDDAKEKMALAVDRCRSLREEEARMLEAQREASAVAMATEKAATLHREVQAWLRIADVLAPSGMPAEMLSTALTPFNTKLREAAVMTGWRQVAINADMAILSEGRPYALLSESERWRTDAMIGYAIASHGPRFLMLDRMDVLDIPARGEALAWIAALVQQNRLDGAVICATLKASPGALPDGVEGYWLEGGQVLDLKQAA